MYKAIKEEIEKERLQKRDKEIEKFQSKWTIKELEIIIEHVKSIKALIDDGFTADVSISVFKK